MSKEAAIVPPQIDEERPLRTSLAPTHNTYAVTPDLIRGPARSSPWSR